jgi:hypothetical protein
MNNESLKQFLVNYLKKINYNGGTDFVLNHIRNIENEIKNKEQNDIQNKNLEHLSLIRMAIHNISSESNTYPMDGSLRMRGFKDVQSFAEYMLLPSIYNIQNNDLLIDLLSFFDGNILYINDLKELTTRNSILIQDNLNLTNQLATAINKIESVQKRLEHLIDINLLQNDEILILKEIIRDYQQK